MTLNAQQREQVRLSLLRYGLSTFSLGLARQYLHSEGFTGISVEQTGQEIEYLEDKGLIEVKGKLLSPENRVWRTNAAGRDFLATEGIE